MRTTTEHGEIAAVLAAALAADPVRATVLGTMRRALGPTAWAAIEPRGVVAVRSDAAHPVAVLGNRPRLAAELARLPDLAGLSGPVDAVDGLLAALPHEVAGRTPTALYRLDELRAPGDVAGSGGRASRADRDVLIGWFTAFLGEIENAVGGGDVTAEVDGALAAGSLYTWRDTTGRPVAMARRRPVDAGSARIGPVYTPPEQRGHGYGSAVTAAATASVLAEGAVPVLFTELSNATANRIYRAMGYTLVENRLMVRFA